MWTTLLVCEGKGSLDELPDQEKCDDNSNQMRRDYRQEARVIPIFITIRLNETRVGTARNIVQEFRMNYLDAFIRRRLIRCRILRQRTSVQYHRIHWRSDATA